MITPRGSGAARRSATVAIALVFLAVGRPAAAFEVGERVDVLSYGAWFEAEVLQVRDGQYLIHYVGWDSSWDEWVEPSNIRYPTAPVPPADAGQAPSDTGAPPSAAPAAASSAPPVAEEPPSFRPADRYVYRVGDTVEVRSGGGGYVHRAEIVDTDGTRYLIKYDGYESTEWTGRDRIRLPEEGAVWDALMDRFHHDVTAEGTLGYFQDESPAPASEYNAGPIRFDQEILIHKRETEFGRIDRHGRVSVGDHMLGRVFLSGPDLIVRRNGRQVGVVAEDGTIQAGDRLLGTVDPYGEITDPSGKSIGAIDPYTGYLIGYWGYASHTGEELNRRLVTAFMFFFTELPHAMQRLGEY